MCYFDNMKIRNARYVMDVMSITLVLKESYLISLGINYLPYFDTSYEKN